MAPRLVQRLRKIVDFKTDVPRELKRQLRELEQGFADALAGFADGVSSLFTGLDGVDVTGNTIRSSRDVKIYTAGGNNLGGGARADIYRFELTAHATVTGFVAPGLNDTHRKLVVNASAYTLTFTHDATSAAANRLYTPHLVAFELRPSECTWIDYDRKSSRWRVTDQAQPFHMVRAVADLPTAVAGVITLTAGLWAFYGAINVGSNRVVQPAGAFVWCPEITSYLGANTASAALTVSNHLNTYQMQVVNFGSGLSVEGTAGAGQDQEFHDWYVNFGDKNQHFTSPSFKIRGGQWGEITAAATAGGNYAFEQTLNYGFTITSGSSLNAIRSENTIQPDKSTGNPMITVPNGVTIVAGVFIYRCEGFDNGLVSLGTGINGGGTAYPRFVALDCIGGSNSSGDIAFGAVPAGRATIIGCKLWTTPFNGFTSLTAGVRVLNCVTVFGGTIQDTPNGHIVKNNAGTEQTQRHYVKAGDGLDAADDGTNTVFSLLRVTDTLTFADDATYGYELSAQLPVTSLPSSCVAAIRVACAWGVTAASGGAIGDINRDGSGWVYIQVTKNSGTLVQVEYTYDRLGTPVPEYHIVHEDLFDDGNNPATAGTFYVQLTSGQIEVFVRIPGTGTHSGATYEGTATMFVDSVHTRTALS